MKWDELLRIVGKEPVFHSSLLKTGPIDPVDIGRQLSRWVKTGKLIQIRRGLYSLSENYRKSTPHPFFVANRLKRGSYVSLQSALEFYGLIPEYVPNITSVTTTRPETLSTPLGMFVFRHVKNGLLFGYDSMEIVEGQTAFIAFPEKALLDLLYLTSGSDTFAYIKELRLQNTDKLDNDRLKAFCRRTGSQKLSRALDILYEILEEEP